MNRRTSKLLNRYATHLHALHVTDVAHRRERNKTMRFPKPVDEKSRRQILKEAKRGWQSLPISKRPVERARIERLLEQ